MVSFRQRPRLTSYTLKTLLHTRIKGKITQIQYQPASSMERTRRRAAKNMTYLKQPAPEGFQDRCVPSKGTAVLFMSQESGFYGCTNVQRPLFEDPISRIAWLRKYKCLAAASMYPHKSTQTSQGQHWPAKMPYFTRSVRRRMA